MQRRLYFMLPDAGHARRVVSDLEGSGLPRSSLHAMARPGADLGGLPAATPVQQVDRLHGLERLLWRGNLLFFFLMLALFIAGLADGSPWLAALGATAMAASFIAGLLWTYVPDAAVHEFDDALGHGEILLMVDVAPRQVEEIERRVHGRHPEAAVGGVSFLAGASNF